MMSLSQLESKFLDVPCYKSLLSLKNSLFVCVCHVFIFLYMSACFTCYQITIHQYFCFYSNDGRGSTSSSEDNYNGIVVILDGVVHQLK